MRGVNGIAGLYEQGSRLGKRGRVPARMSRMAVGGMGLRFTQRPGRASNRVLGFEIVKETEIHTQEEDCVSK